jgi:hypothetical protein
MQSLFNFIAGIGLVIICPGVLIWVFLLAPLPYIIGAGIVKVEKRNYWRAFGVGIITTITGVIISLLLGWIPAVGFIVAFIAGSLVEVFIIMGLYSTTFGKAILVWLVALIFVWLIRVLLVLGVLALTGVGLSEIIQQIPGLRDLLPNVLVPFSRIVV